MKLRAPSSCVVFTPKLLANAMALALHPRKDERFLEPCVGNGSLVRALAHQGVSAEMIRALDLDETPRPSDRYANVARGVDFLEWSLSTNERFEKIIANPPYLALNRLQKRLQKNALRVINPFSRTRVSLGGNYWYAFLCASISLLERDGSLCFLLPAAWDYSNYARHLRDALPQHFEQVLIHRSRRPLFENVHDGSVILLAHGFRRSNKTAARVEHVTVKDLVASLAKPLQSTGKSIPRDRVVTLKGIKFTKLRDLVKIHIGAVTGHAEYFLMTEDRRRALQIPTAACVPVLTRSSHVTSAIVNTHDWQVLRDSSERVWLFRPTKRSLRNRAVQKYLRLSLKKGGCARHRFKIRLRSPWYKTVLPTQVQGFLSGMSSAGPWISLSAMRGLYATNTLYVVTFRKAETRAEKAAIALSLLTAPARNALSDVERRYADGLLKYEPGDLRDIEVPVVTRLRGVITRYRQAVRKLLEGDALGAQQLADEWMN